MIIYLGNKFKSIKQLANYYKINEIEINKLYAKNNYDIAAALKEYNILQQEKYKQEKERQTQQKVQERKAQQKVQERHTKEEKNRKRVIINISNNFNYIYNDRKFLYLDDVLRHAKIPVTYVKAYYNKLYKEYKRITEEIDITDIVNNIKKDYAEYINNLQEKEKQKQQKEKQEKEKQQKLKQEIQSKEQKDIKIKHNDFIIKTNVFRCRNKEHKLKDLIAELNLINIDGCIDTVKIHCGYCENCKQYFIMEDIWNRYIGNKIPICNVIKHINLESSIGLNTESILYMHGYNVEAKNNTSSQQRKAIIDNLIITKTLSISELISYLRYFINMHKNIQSHKGAVTKWRNDLNYILEKYGKY